MEPQAFDAIAWYQCDHLGTPMELTDHNGAVAWTGQYRAWGEVREERSGWAKQIGLSNPIRFQGQYHDRETGLHYNRYRYYDPGIGRFISQDPVSYSGGLNLYLYAPNPIEWADPLGLEKVVETKSRAQALRLAQKHAQVPRVGRGGTDIPVSKLNPESRGKNYACLCARGSTLGRKEEGAKPLVFDHPDGHPHMVGEGFPAHHNGPHVHAKNKKGEVIIFTYPGQLKCLRC